MPRLIAIDLGAYSVKATVFNGTSRRQTLEERVERPVGDDSPGGAPLAARLAAMSDLLKSHPQWARGGATVALAWPAELATVHRMSLPFTDRAQVEKTLPFAVESEVPFDLDTMVIGSRIQTRDKDTEAMVAFTKKDAVRAAIDLLAAASLDPRYVLVESDLSARFCARDQVVAVVDVGHGNSVTSVVRGGRVVFARVINVAGRDFTESIAQKLGVSFAEAEFIKHGERDAPKELVEAALRDPLGLLLAEVRSCLIAAEDALGVDIHEVRLTGGGARLSSLAGFLADDLGVALDWLNDGQDAIPLGWAVGDALAEILVAGDPGEAIDLRTGDLAWRGGFDALRAVLLYGAPLLVFMSLTLIVVSAVQWKSLDNELADVDGRIKSTVSTTLGDVTEDEVRDGTIGKAMLSERAKEVISRAELLDRTDNTPPTVEKLKQLTEAFPPNDQVKVDVTSLTITADNISFDAETDGYTSSSAVEDALKGNPTFSQAVKGNEKKARDKITFTMNIPLGAAPTEGG